MRYSQGGTQMWCPACEKVTVCKAIAPPPYLVVKPGQLFYRQGHEDVQWFRRCRVCQDCSSEWLTAELPEKCVDELVQLRDVLAEIKTNVQVYTKDAENAAQSLANLSESLSALQRFAEPPTDLELLKFYDEFMSHLLDGPEDDEGND